MIVTSDTKIFNPVYNPELASKHREYRDELNSQMTSVKYEWARNVLNYNKVSKEAIKYRFQSIPDSKIILDSSKDKANCVTTEEQINKRPYIVSNIGMKKVRTFNDDFCARDYSCQVKTKISPDQLYNVQSLMNNVFDKSSFQLSLHAAFFDATIKKVGYVRNRVYNTQKSTYLVDPISGKNKVLSKQGHLIEYVDVENVVVDPYKQNPSDCFICTPYSAEDLLNLFPQMRNFLIETSESCVKETDLGNMNEKNEYEINYIEKERLANYKLGESLVEIYNKPDLTKHLSSGLNSFSNSLSTFLDGLDLTRTSGYKQTLSLDEMMSLNGVTTTSLWNKNQYLLNEFFDWNTGRYAVFIGDYVLYDGAMFGELIECPLGKIYFQHKEQQGWFGKAVIDSIWSDLLEIDITYNKNERAFDEARAKIMEVNKALIDDDSGSIQMQEGYTYIERKPTDSNGNDTTNIPIIRQIPIVDQLLPSYGALEQGKIAKIHEIYPETGSLNVQLSREAVQDTIFSRDSVTNSILRLNSLQLSKFAYLVYASIIFAINFTRTTEIVIEGKINDKIGIVIRDNKEDLEFAKQQVAIILKQEYESSIDEVKARVKISRKYIDAGTIIIQQTTDELNQQNVKYLVENNITPSQEDKDKVREMLGARIQDKLDELLTQMTGQIAEQQNIVKQEDDNWYYTTEALLNSISLHSSWSFEFSKSKAEQKQGLINLVSTMSNLPLAGYSLDYMEFLKQLCNIENLSPSIVSEVQRTTEQVQGSINTKINVFAQSDKDPNVVHSIVSKNLNIPIEQLADVKSGSFNFQKAIASQKAIGEVIKVDAQTNTAQAMQSAIQFGNPTENQA